jgi:hypothetical protein
MEKKSIERTGILGFGALSFGITGLIIFTIQYMRGSNTSESPDQLIYFLSLFCVFTAIGFGYFKKSFPRPFNWISYISVLFFCLGLYGIENHFWVNIDLSEIYWLGFGPGVLALVFLFSIFIHKILDWDRLTKFWKILISCLVISNLMFSLLSFWQSSDSLIDPGHSEYVINEIFAQLSGFLSYSSFIPQYQSFYGLFLVPFSQHLTIYQLSNIIIYGLTAIAYLTLFLTVYLCWISIGKKSIVIAIAIIVPLTSVTQFPNRSGFQGSIAALLSAIPVRVFPGIFLLFVTFFAIKRINSKPTRFNALPNLVGILAGVLAWQSQDFGMAAVVSMFATFLIANKRKTIDFKNIFYLSLFFIGGIFVYPLVAFLTGNSLKLEYLLFFQRQFGSGFGAEMIRTPGPIFIILPLVVALIVIHGLMLLSVKGDGLQSEAIRNASTIGFFSATWSLLGFIYYVNRSYASGQMQILLLSISLSIGALIGIYLEDQKILISSEVGSSHNVSIKLRGSQLVFYSLIFSLPFGSLLLTPNPKIEVLRVSSSIESPRWPPKSLTDAVEDGKIANEVFSRNGLKLGYFGNSGSLIQFDQGISNLLPFNSPADLVIGNSAYAIACRHIQKINPDGILLDDSGIAFVMQRGGMLCNNYSIQDLPPIRSGHFMLKIEK